MRPAGVLCCYHVTVRKAIILVSCLIFPVTASAGQWLDYLRSIDLNDYAFGLAVTAHEHPYVGAKNSAFAFPYLTSFEHPAFNDKLVVVNDGEIGFRGLRDSGWEFGLLGRIQTLGLGNHRSDALIGIADRKWAVEMGPSVGFRGWPVQLHASAFLEPTDRHDGWLGRVRVSYPLQTTRGFVVPALEWIYQDQKYNDYYFSVTDAEALPGRPAYAPGGSVNTRASVRFGYRLADQWLLSGGIGMEWLGDEIRQSPIIEETETWFATLGLAYNSGVFRSEQGAMRDQRPFSMRVSIFEDGVDSRVRRDTANGIPGEEIDIEDVLGESEEETVLQLDVAYQWSRYHRFEAGWFELVRKAREQNSAAIVFGDQVIAPGNDLSSKSHVRSLRLGYAYSIMRDAQKTLSLMAGVHFTTFELAVISTTSGENLRTRADAPLPVIGLDARFNVRANTSVGAKAQLFRTDFDHHEGSLTYATVDVSHRVSERATVGLGYNYYQMKLRSGDSDLNGIFEMRHRGPLLFVDWGF